MHEKRIVRTTCRILLVMAGLLLAVPGTAGAAEGPDEMAVDRALRRVIRTNLPLSERLKATGIALGGTGQAEGEALVRAGLALLADAPEAGAWLLLRGIETRWPDRALVERGRARVRDLLAGAAEQDERRATWAAAGLLVGLRPPEVPADVTSRWPPDGATAAILRREAGIPRAAVGAPAGAEAVRQALTAALPAARALDAATSEEPEVMCEGLDALLAQGGGAAPVLLAEARSAAVGVPEGRLPRVTRAILALGLLGPNAGPEAVEVLTACLEASEGWVQVAAATALGDLGRPCATIALCHQLTYRGDVLRPRDQWDYPGDRETTIAREDWATVAHYAVDAAAADALLRLGVPGAAGWLIRHQLDPSRAKFRVRVLQDAVDALARATSAPVSLYNPDAGIPQRRRAFEALLAWWMEHRYDEDLLGRRLDADDEGFRCEARRMVERLRGRSVMELQISQETCALLGPAVTPTLLETLAVARNRTWRGEIARALGGVRDVRAIPALLGLLGNRAAFLRSVAAESIGAYVVQDDRVAHALVERLDDPETAPRIAALRSLVAAPPSAALREALRAHTPAAHRQAFGFDDRDYRMAWTIAMLVQEGEAWWPAVYAGLAHPEGYVRRTWWDLLCRALGLSNHVFDASTDPSAPGWTPADEPRLLEALAKRRSS